MILPGSPGGVGGTGPFKPRPNPNPYAQVLVDAVVHAVNEDYEEMAGDFIKLGFLTPGTDISPIVPALEKIWRDSKGQSLADFNFRRVEGARAFA